ncbi:DUF397 domain-containing protein [Saccharopolyspora pogona]|uniref:DUF397 domain-containing protein n=1 Tax=Saccharopolyspora pogona TaxID=333966 RepID=UPI0016859C24|nr:DUF397 domain-containing protein [Saccharopolyspora pogona]
MNHSEAAPLPWRTSTYSQNNAACVEIAMTPIEVGVRDTKDRSGGQLNVPAARFAAFIDTIKATNGWRSA